VSSRHSGEKTEFGPGKTPLYYNNVGLFSDPFLEDRLPNLEKFYNHPSTTFLNDFWNIEESDDADKFNEAFQKVMNLWDKLDKNVPKYCTKERQLQNTWIDKIFEYLGWTIELEETSSKNGITNFPDYALFASVEDWKKSKDLTGNNKFKRATAVADAKDWGISLDGKGFSNKNPSFQIINYLKQTDKSWGVLTDGKFWRIYSLRSDSKHSTFYEIDLEKILATGDQQRFKYFFNFFRVDAFKNDARLNDRTFLDFVFDDGQFYSKRVEKNLNERVYRVVDAVSRGFLVNYDKPNDSDLKAIYEYSMYYVFKLMFVLNCESKGLLEVNKQDDYYDSSLRKKCFEIKEQLEQGKNWSQQARTYNYILELFDLLKTGDSKIGVHGFGSEPFEIGSQEFYRSNKIQDDLLNAALIELSCDRDEEKNLQFIDYKILSPDHIGSLFEGLLEFNLVAVGKKIELVNTKGDRKATGSYYTPDYLVDYIVEETLGDLVANKNPSEILKLKVLDPSMGSGHFLLGVVKYLEKQIVKVQDTDDNVKGAIQFDKVKKEVLKNCVFGVDINSLATQLAKFSLWIYTAEKGDSVQSLKSQLVAANTLSDKFDWKTEFGGKITFGVVDAVVGNPPYIGEKGNKGIFHAIKDDSIGKKFYQGKMDYFYFFFHKTLDLLKENGVASLVSTNYFVSATGAKKLRTDLKNRATLTKIINFNELRIFKGAQGQHNQVTFFSKGHRANASCSCYIAKEKGACDLVKLQALVDSSNQVIQKNSGLYQGADNQIRFGALTDNAVLDGILSKMSSSKLTLKDVSRINTGADVTISEIKKSHLKKFKGDFKENDGVFVISKKEILAAGIGKSEGGPLKPYIKCSDVKRYSMEVPDAKKLIYFTWTDSIKPYPAIEKHLKKFKSILVDQMERYGEEYPWYALHRPRDQENFECKDKLVVPYRAKENIFSYCPAPVYSSRDVLFILPQKHIRSKALAVLLNSRTYYVWLYHKGKRKGDTLELYQTPLSEMPIPDLSDAQITSLTKMYDEIESFKYSVKIIEKAERFVTDLFGMTVSEVDYILNFRADSSVA
jgi:methylase of polypeptide subunit release factors